MNLSTNDWVIVGVTVAVFASVIVYMQRHSKGVAGFLAANRCAGRYLLCIAAGMAAMGEVSIISQMQIKYESGLASNWWHSFGFLFSTLLAVTGWIVYRFRETRVLTLAQFFEMRYSRRFRIFAGTTAFVAGIANYGIFPAIGSQFFINFCGLPEKVAGIPTFYVVMISLITVSILSAVAGGQVTVIATDFMQGMFMNFVFLMILIVILKQFSVGTILDGLEYAPAGKSMLNPIDIQGHKKGFDLWFFAIGTLMMVYGYKVWQAEQGYGASAKTPHDAKMAGILGSYRFWGFLGAITLIPLAAYTVMNHPDYVGIADQVKPLLAKITNPEVRSQMVTPIILSKLIPSGLMGLFTAAMLAAAISTHNTQLHSWGSIFIQDIIAPLRKKPLSTRAHMLLLRISVVMVGVLVCLFSAIFRQTQHFQIYVMISGGIYISGCGIVLIGGLYWKKGTTQAAWTAMFTGATIAITAIVLDQIWIRLYGDSFPLSFKWCAFIAAMSSTVAYIVVSLISNTDFNMDRMLHRGAYKIASDHEMKESKTYNVVLTKLGLTSEFSNFDKFLWGFKILSSVFFFVYASIVTGVYLTVGFREELWRTFQAIWLWWIVILFVPIAAWLSIGGMCDAYKFVKGLKEAKLNALDDGRISGDHNLADQ